VTINVKKYIRIFVPVVLAIFIVLPAMSAQADIIPRVNADPTSTILQPGQSTSVTVVLDEPIIAETPPAYANVMLNADSGLVALSDSELDWAQDEWQETRTFTITDTSLIHPAQDTIVTVTLTTESNSEYYQGFATHFEITLPGIGGETTTTSPVDPTVAFGEMGTTTTADVSPGASTTIHGSGFLANSQVTVSLHSTPQILGKATVNSQGSFVFTFVMPTLSGAHQIVVDGTSAAGDPTSQVLSVNIGELPATGSDSQDMAIVAFIVIAGGLACVFAARKKKTP
jgi:LPXTG-motif cell wall-anchored protein